MAVYLPGPLATQAVGRASGARGDPQACRGRGRAWVRTARLPAPPHRGPQFWSAYTPCDTQNKDSVKRTLEQIDVIQRMCQLYPETFLCVTDSAGGCQRPGQGGGGRPEQRRWAVPSHCSPHPQASSRPSRRGKWPVWLAWRAATPSTAVWVSCGRSTTWACAT